MRHSDTRWATSSATCVRVLSH